MIESKALPDLDLGLLLGKVALAVGEHTAAQIIAHLNSLTDLLDEGDDNDAFGTEGWRHRLGIEN